MQISEKKLIVVAGPTASGKTELAIQIARHFETSVVSADSRQVYKEMTIGTAVPEPHQLAAVPHYFIHSHTNQKPLTAGKYETEALALLDTLFQKQDTVVLCGGSGLYIRALCEGFDAIPPASEEVVRQVQELFSSGGLEALRQALLKRDPKTLSTIDAQNPRRLMRALEICIQMGKPASELRKGKRENRPFSILKIAPNWHRDILYQKINLRVDKMIEQGLEKEAASLLPFRHLSPLDTVGYREFFQFFDGHISFEKCVELIKQNTRRFAKRQLTWFRQEQDLHWIEKPNLDIILSLLNR